MCNPCPPTEKDSSAFSNSDNPLVTITSHTNNQTVGKNFTIEATVTGTDEDISEVKFSISPAVTSEKKDTSSPFRGAFNNIPNGTYVITVQATDSAGNFDSEQITLNVSG
jgi:hypothetical protein